MNHLLQRLKRLTGPAQRPTFPTHEELEWLKRDAIENRRKHY